MYQSKIAECDREIEAHMGRFADRSGGAPAGEQPGKNRVQGNAPRFDVRGHLYRMTGVDLTRINGVDAYTALKVIGEVGTDMTRWPTAKHFASWLGLSPNNRVTGGRVISSRTKPTASRAAKALRQAANALYRSDSALGAFLRRKKAQLGAPKAITATAKVIGEVGTDMTRWPTAKHFASWLGLSPNNRVTGGRVISSRTKPTRQPGSQGAETRRPTPCTAPTARWELSCAGRIKAQLGAPKAITATAHKLARIIYAMLRYGQQYADAGAEYYEAHYHGRLRCGRQKEGRRDWATSWCPHPMIETNCLICPWQQPRPAGENLSYSIVKDVVASAVPHASEVAPA